MRASRRRLYTASVSLVAGTIVLAALLSGMFRLAMELAPAYRQDLANWVSQTLGRPVSIARFDLSWRGFAPSLDLNGVVLFEPDTGVAALRFETLRLGFGLDALMGGARRPDRIEVHGMTLVVRRDDAGQWRIRGVDAAQGGDPLPAVLAELSHFRQLRFERCTLVFEGLLEQSMALDLREAVAQRGAGGFFVRLDAELPPALGGGLQARLRVNGDPARIASWTGDWRLSADALRLGALLEPWLVRTDAVSSRGLELHLAGGIDNGEFAAVDLHLNAEGVDARPDLDGLGEVEDLSLIARLERHAGTLKLGLRRLSAGGANPWTMHAGTLDWSRDAEGRTEALRLDLDRVPLDAVAPWLDRFAGLDPALARTLASLRGELRGVVLRAHRTPDDALRYAYRAELVGVSGRHGDYAVEGLNGELAGSELAGRLSLQDAPLRLALEHVFEPVLPVDSLRGELQWSRSDSGWRVNLRELQAHLLGAEAQADMDLLLPAGRAAEIALDLRFAASDATRFAPYMPLKWSPGLRQWLARSVRAARVRSGQLLLRGPMDRYPFREPRDDEVFRITLDVADARLDYAERWPPLEAADAALRFENGGMRVDLHRARMRGMPVARAVATIADFHRPKLTVDAHVEARGEPLYRVLREAPLRERFAGLTDHTRAQGPIPLDLHIELPLKDLHASRVAGRAQLDGVSLHYLGMQEPFRDLRGTVRFDGPAVEASGVTGRFFDLALQADLMPMEGGGLVLTADFDLEHGKGGPAEASCVPPWLIERMQGRAHWRASLPLGRNAVGPLVLSSPLEGVAIDLPAGLSKSPGQSRFLRVAVSGQAEALDLDLQYGRELAARVRLGREAGKWRERATAVALGTMNLPALQPGVRRISGQIQALSVDDIIALNAGAPSPHGSLPLLLEDVAIGRLDWHGYSVSALRVNLRSDAQARRLELNGDNARGTVDWLLSGAAHVDARLDRLALQYEPQQSEASGAVLDPRALPTLALRISELWLNDTRLGRLELQTARLGDGQRLSVFSLQGDGLQLHADGQWWRQQDRSGAELAIRAELGNIDRLLRAFGYAPSIQARRARVSGDFRWSPSADGIQWAQARGELSLRVDDGTLRAVEPGAGRVLGLVNFYALPRRLSLNFKDVLGQGLAFDRIKGDFQLGDGNAVTDNLVVDGPSLRIETRGRIGLAARDYDQRVTVYPDVSSGVTLASALLGGPALGALVMLAQEILDKPLDQATQLSYRLSGSWDNPTVTRLGPGQGGPPLPERTP